MSGSVAYHLLRDGDPLPSLEGYCPFKAVIVIEAPFSTGWQNEVARWLVDGGCLYMMAWGPGCSSWDDAVDWANIDDFAGREIPPHRFVMTSWHEQESLEELFWFAHHAASPRDGSISLDRTVILHIARELRGEEMMRRFQDSIEAPR